ncbi:MAG: hypothetical protein CFK52_08330 [Chloracidobacterium sp. CP2_5A]|nr:MAG: hypothetical protein CFK52_08330 [Chloracidobacterium sp. CP2_5A]
MTSDQSSLVGQIIDEKVRLEAILGQGGMGAVYRGRHLMLERTVAVKVLRPEILTIEGALERFFREARTAAATEHPNIVTVYDFGKLPDGGAYLILEFIEGKGLRAILQEQAILPPSLALPILSEVCAAVEFAHRRSIIHRDLKPDNIMLKRRDDGSATAKVLDFGLAKTVEEAETSSSITRTGELVGTPAYMSPEHCSGDNLDARSDLYSLAIIAYEMLCGQPPFRGRVAAILTSQIQRPPAPLRDLNPNLSPALEEAVLSGLAKKPYDRPASVAEWWNRLETAYVATYGEKPSATIPLALPEPTPFVAPPVTGAAAPADQAITPRERTLPASGAPSLNADAETAELSALSSASSHQQPSPASSSALRVEAPPPVAPPRAGTGTLAIGATLTPAEDNVTGQTVVTPKGQGGQPKLSRLQRMGLAVGGAAALVTAGGLAATSWMRSATTPVAPPAASQPVAPPVEAGPAPAAQDADSSPAESASRRPSRKAEASNGNRSARNPNQANNDAGRAAQAEPPTADAPDERPTPSPSPPRPQPESRTARAPRAEERRPNWRDGRRWWEVWKIGRDKRDNDKRPRPRD